MEGRNVREALNSVTQPVVHSRELGQHSRGKFKAPGDGFLTLLRPQKSPLYRGQRDSCTVRSPEIVIVFIRAYSLTRIYSPQTWISPSSALLYHIDPLESEPQHTYNQWPGLISSNWRDTRPTIECTVQMFPPLRRHHHPFWQRRIYKRDSVHKFWWEMILRHFIQYAR